LKIQFEQLTIQHFKFVFDVLIQTVISLRVNVNKGLSIDI